MRYVRDANGDVIEIWSKASSSATNIQLVQDVDNAPFGGVKYIHYGNNTAMVKYFTSDYDVSGIVVEKYGPWARLLARTYHYVDNQNITAITDDLNSANDQDYWYDNNNRLQNGDGSWGEYQYYYDGTGNRQHRILTDGGTTIAQRFWYDENVSNRILSMDLDGTETRTFSHDAAGNMLTDVKNSVSTAYGYNNAGRMTSVSIGGVQKGGYIYNANGQLASRSVLNSTPSTISHSLYDLNGNLIAEADASGTIVREYIWLEHATGGEQTGAATPIAIHADMDTASPILNYVHADHLDRPIMMTDDNQAITWQATYLPFGEVQSVTGTAANDNRFPGQYYQLESGLNYNWHRQYDPSLARYIQADPLGLVDGTSRYAYVNSDPLQMVDPKGLNRARNSGPFGPLGGDGFSSGFGGNRLGFGGGGGAGKFNSPKQYTPNSTSLKKPNICKVPPNYGQPISPIRTNPPLNPVNLNKTKSEVGYTRPPAKQTTPGRRESSTKLFNNIMKAIGDFLEGF
ncbi:MAG: hypothetical protein JKY49_11425 [Cohaesibacteraceae bacterium]|nr:hypothetical protein [Cohaesibacteraceae bacterium]